MLGKLLKYEFKATARYYWIFFVSYFLLCGGVGFLSKVSMNTNNVALGLTITLLFVVLLVSSIFMSLAPIIFSSIRFNKSVLGDEGYLTNTLPVSSNTIVTSKAIIASLWYIATSIWTIICYLFLFLTSEGFKDFLDEMENLFGNVWESLKNHPLAVVLFITGTVLSCISVILIEYASFSFCQRFNSARGLKGSFIMIFILIVNFVIFSTIGVDNVPSDYNNTQMAYWSLGVMNIEAIIFGVLGYFVTQQSLKKHLNIQ